MGEDSVETLEAVELSVLQANYSNLNATNATANRTSMTFSSYYQHSLLVAISFILAYLFIFLLCMLGNVLVCLIVLRDHRMRTVTNLFILNLAVSDLLVGIFCIPTTLVDNLITGWPFTNAVCKMSGLVQGTSVSASVFTLVAIAVDRFRCIVYPFQPKITPLVAKATIAMIWVLAVVIMSPSAAMLTVQQVENHYMIYNDVYNRTYPFYTCYENWPEPGMRTVYTTVLFGQIYLVPLALITLMYSRIGVKLCTSSVLSCSNPREMASARAATPVGQHEGRPVSQRKIRVIKMLIVVALLFMLSWLPLWTLMLLTDYGGLEGDQLDLMTGYIFPFAHWLAFSNSSVNPIIYGYYNENFKRGFQVFCQPHSCCQGGREEREQSLGETREERGGSRDAAANSKPLTFGPRNRVHTDGDLTKCVRLELVWKKTVASNASVSVERGQSQVLSPVGGAPKRRELCIEDIERIEGASVCQAWDA